MTEASKNTAVSDIVVLFVVTNRVPKHDVQNVEKSGTSLDFTAQ